MPDPGQQRVPGLKIHARFALGLRVSGLQPHRSLQPCKNRASSWMVSGRCEKRATSIRPWMRSGTVWEMLIGSEDAVLSPASQSEFSLACRTSFLPAAIVHTPAPATSARALQSAQPSYDNHLPDADSHRNLPASTGVRSHPLYGRR
jgi:hypothetical protein